jgi:transposase
MNQDDFISQLIVELGALTKRFSELELRFKAAEKENQTLHIENQLLKLENDELKARLNSNSHNSSKPPSSDGYSKRPAFTKIKTGKQGGKNGHPGHTLHQIEMPDTIKNYYPGICSCGHPVMAESCSLLEKRQVFDLPKPRLQVTEHRILGGLCPGCGQMLRGESPEGVNAPVQYGHNAKAFSVMLNSHYKLPFKKIQALFNDLFGYSINESTVYSAARQCYEKLGLSEEIIKSKIAESKVAHADETGFRAEGKLVWLHTATTVLFTYFFVHEKRGMGALGSNKSILDRFMGWLVHDCWGSYFKFDGLKHALCCAHILRELEALIENGQSKWATAFKAFLMRVYLMPFEERVKRRKYIESRYAAICKMGIKSEPVPIKTKGQKGRCKRTKGRNLVERLQKEQQAVLAFAFNEEVPFTNNLAERDIRPVKVKQKISNCFRSFEGAEFYARIEGFISTARKQNRNVFNELCNSFEGHNFLTA